jgi:hypothetical protein
MKMKIRMKIKMKTTIYITIAFAFSILMNACETNLTVPLPEHDPKLVVNALLQPDKPLEIYLSRSFGLGENLTKEQLEIPGASVKLFEGGQEVATLSYVDTTLFSGNGTVQVGKYTHPAFVPESGKTYELRVSDAAYDPVSSQTQVTKAVPIKSAKLRVNDFKQTDPDGYVSYQSILEVTLEDPGDMDNFYWFEMETYFRDTTFNPGFRELIRIFIEGPVLRKDPNGYVTDGRWAKDSYFNGQETTIELVCHIPQIFTGAGPDPTTLDIDTFFVNSYSVNKDAFQYLDKLFDQYNSVETIDFFPSEGIVVYNNIEGGYGFMGSLAARRDTFVR